MKGMIKIEKKNENQMYAWLTEKEYNKLMSVLDEYVDYEGDLFCDKCREKKYELDEKTCGLDIFRAIENNYSEVKIGNTYIKDNILTCIFDNQIHKYQMVNRKANKNDVALIIAPCLADGDERGKYINHVFKVWDRTNNDGWTVECATVRINDIEHQGWCLYDEQYVVLEEI